MPRLRAALIAPFLLAAAVPAPTLFAQPPETAATAATPFDRRAAQLVDVLTGKLAFAAYFAPSFQAAIRSEEHTSELQSLMRNSYAVFCLKNKKSNNHRHY